jgi:hypothetical protein
MSNRLSATKKNVILWFSTDQDKKLMKARPLRVAMRPTMLLPRAGQQLLMITGGLPLLIGIILRINNLKKKVPLIKGLINKIPVMDI